MIHNNAVAKNSNNNFIPPLVKGLPKMKGGVATIRLVTPLSINAEQRFTAEFRKYCDKQHLKLTLIIDGLIVTIKRAVHRVLYKVLKGLKIDRPQPKVSAAMKTGEVPAKKAKKNQDSHAVRPLIGLRLATR